MYQVLNQWGYEGFFKHVDKVTEFYRERKDQCMKAAEKHLTGSIVTWHKQQFLLFS